ncbi:ribonuclease E [Solemya velum gill symbiont]|uniref:ribonuclease E n=1 Tax=Solemya velum gill symbiont TaxID=2340 RepID=UPI0009977DBE|nr:ribonuclease E [Solemya velum gill symbiont]OOY97248.1 hypothetical protein BOW19_11020 [Solemya velum gill symbiont]OOY99249.1 hypothetical protein BOW20_11015 [Solemya velum gill symbiont]OOZ01754.1 hypothetical protein BOW21_11060 [Solemya velum gill symbiont]OOZ03728.1 hypothetical protein BOW22_10970 [Solemya velum gill symbiont]OOZ05970.1 hypothetical protein BOW23_10975 [Solemya velum gill symbiont]
MKRMLINATQPEELRVAIVDGQSLFNLDIELPGREQKKSNVYKGRITRVEPSLEAAFVEYGSERHGFLPLKEISRTYFNEEAQKACGRVSIQDAIKEGMEVIVQVEKEERGNKGAALTTFVSLAGRYLVLVPKNPRAGGISRRIEGEDRSELRQAMSQLEVPEGMGLIIRTAGIGKSAEELQWDLDYLTQVWTAIETTAEERKAPFLIYQESNVIIRSIRDHLRTDIGEIVIDDPNVFKEAEEFVSQVMPHNKRKLKLYSDETPLFSRYQIESQIESAFEREVRLPSGGAIVIDHTEALVSIDINSSRATKGADIEETALNTNLEAADEVARQLRLRDLGGLFVIDFIDMSPSKNQRAVENRLKDALKDDRARVQVGRISRFGLLEMSRQRLRPSLGEAAQHVCPRCEGHGFVRSVESLALSILRLIEEHALKENTGRVIAQLPVDVATYLLNEKRPQIHDIEKRQKIEVVLVPNQHLETPHYTIERVRQADVPAVDESTSYKMVSEPETVVQESHATRQARIEEPAVKKITPVSTRPEAKAVVEESAETAETGLLKRLFGSLFSSAKVEEPEEKKEEQKRPAPRSRSNSQRNNRRGSRGRGSQGQQASRKQKAAQDKSAANANKTEKPESKKQGATDAQQGDKPKSSRGRRGGRRGGRRSSAGRQDGNTAQATDQQKTGAGSEKQVKAESQTAKTEPKAAKSEPKAQAAKSEPKAEAPKAESQVTKDDSGKSDDKPQSSGRQQQKRRPRPQRRSEPEKASDSQVIPEYVKQAQADKQADNPADKPVATARKEKPEQAELQLSESASEKPRKENRAVKESKPEKKPAKESAPKETASAEKPAAAQSGEDRKAKPAEKAEKAPKAAEKRAKPAKPAKTDEGSKAAAPKLVQVETKKSVESSKPEKAKAETAPKAKKAEAKSDAAAGSSAPE